MAGGLLKGASLDAEVARIASRLVGGGADRPRRGQEVAEALSRHAPDVPVVQVVTGEDAGMYATAESLMLMWQSDSGVGAVSALAS